MATKQKYTPETIIVLPVNKEKLDRDITDRFHAEGKPADVTYSTRGKVAIIINPLKCLIDEEFIGNEITEETITFPIYESGTKESGGWFSMFPTCEVPFKLIDLNAYFNDPITLAEFTKARRGYNGRIRGNEGEWMEFLNS